MEHRESIDLDLSRYLLMIKRHWMLAASVFAATVTLSAFATTFLKPSYEAEGNILFKLPSFNVVGSNLLSNNAEGGETGNLRPLVSSQNPIATQVEVISSAPLLQQTIDKLQLKNKKGESLGVEELKKALTLKIVGGTDVLRITYEGRSPQEAAAVVNTIMNLYLENDVLTNRSEAVLTRTSMSKQLPKTQTAIYGAEVELRKFRQKYNVVDLSEEAKSAVSIIGNFDTQLNNLKSELDQVNAQSNELRQKVGLTPQQAIAMSAISQSRAVQGVLTQLQDTEQQLATESSRLSDNNPVITNLEAKRSNLIILLQEQIQQTIGSRTQVPSGLLQIGELRQNLIQNFLQLELQRLGLVRKITSLANSRFVYEQRAKIIPQLIQNQSDLERKAEVARSTYQTLLKKIQELQLAENKDTANARIIAQAVAPEKPLSGKKTIILLLGIMVGAILSTTIVLFLETRDKSLKTFQEIREIFGYTILGIIPLSANKTRSLQPVIESTIPEIAVRDKPRSLTSEMYRIIQSNLKFLSSDKVLKTIVVTSAVPKEGKSTVAANLAAAMAQLGHRVLIIDADMRVPSQHHLWRVVNKGGLSEVLVGQAQLNTATYEVMDNLDVLTSGIRPPNPLALLDSKRMASLIDGFSSKYDFVIIDAPPLLLAADALALSKMTDGILLVARPEVIDSSSARAVKDMLYSSAHNILGLVINGITEKYETNSYFHDSKAYFADQEVLDGDEEDSYLLCPAELFTPSKFH